MSYNQVEGLAKIRGNRVHLGQVLLNIANNAIVAMGEKGTLSFQLETLEVSDNLKASTCLEVEPGNYVGVSISDTGKGISPTSLNHIFEPFYTSGKEGKGCGLGLSIVKSLVQNYGGFVTVDSTLGEGTTFKVYFPTVC